MRPSLMLAALMVLTACQSADPQAGAVSPPPPRSHAILIVGIEDTERDRHVYEQLRKPLKAIDGPHMLVNVIDYFRNTMKVNILVDWAALEAVGVDGDTMVPAIPAAAAQDMLKSVLKSVCETTSAVDPLAFMVRDGILHISIRNDFRLQTETRLYILPPSFFQPIARAPTYRTPPQKLDDLFHPRSGVSPPAVPPAPSAPSVPPVPPCSLDPQPSVWHGQAAALGGLPVGSHLAHSPRANRSEQRLARATRSTHAPSQPCDIVIPNPTGAETSDELVEQLLTLIQDATGVQSDWAAYGGEVANLRMVNGVLIVRTNRDAHDEIARLLTQLAGGSLAPWLCENEANYLVMKAEEARLAGRSEEAVRLTEDALFALPTSVRAVALRKVLADTLGKPYAIPATLRPQHVERPDATAGPPPARDVAPASAKGEMKGETKDEMIYRLFHERLSSPLPVNFEGNKLVNTVDYFRNTIGVSFFVNWAALEDAGIEQDTPIHMELVNAPASAVLHLVLRQASAGAKEPADFMVTSLGIPGDDNKIVVAISTRKDLEKNTDTRVYDIRDLLDWGTDDYSMKLLHGRSDLRSVASMRFEGNEKLGVEPMSMADVVEMIVDAVPRFIGRPGAWSTNGGDIASLLELNGNLIIKCTADDHRAVQRLLDDLRLARVLSTVALMRHREVLHLMQKADELRMAMRYDEALALTDRALRVDPQHELAVAMKQVVEETMARRKAAGR